MIKKIFSRIKYTYLSIYHVVIFPVVNNLSYYYIRLRIAKHSRIYSKVPDKGGSRESLALETQTVPFNNNFKRIDNRKKPHILFCIDKWCECRTEYGLCNTDHNLCGSLEATKLATQERFYFDENQFKWYQSKETALLSKCLKSNPDILILLWPSTPQLKILKLIRDGLQIPVVVIWGDLVNHMEEAEAFLPFVSLNLVWDSSSVFIGKTNQPEKYMPIWTPQDPRIFHNPDLPRDIDVSFVGTMKDHPDRFAGISALRSNGIDVYQSGGQREHRLPIDEYARIYMRSKIALNFCYHPNGMVQIKGHIFEATLCGAMLMEADNTETAKLFKPFVDYVPFKDETDLVEKVKYYLAHDSERKEIAARGHQKAKELYTGEMFWRSVFRRVFDTNYEYGNAKEK